MESTIHSTDAHGFTEVNFAVTYLLGVAFTPRIQSFQDQHFYAFAGMAVPDLAAPVQRLGKPLDRGLIEAQWETILRLIISLKQKHVTASTVLRRLKFVLPAPPPVLGPARVGAGRAHRVSAALHGRPGPAQAINDQLDKLGSIHHFARAVFYGQNGQFRYAGREEQ